MIRIGITGGIGSGKSVASKLLRMMGVPVYDTDQRAKELQVEDAELKAQITSILGKEAYNEDGSLNKPYIAGKIFSNKALLAQINATIHPAVANDFERWTKKQEEEGREIVGLESAILHQANLERYIDKVWTVEAPLETCIERACKRDNKNRADIEARVRNQRSITDTSDSVIKNDDAHSLIEQITALLAKL